MAYPAPTTPSLSRPLPYVDRSTSRDDLKDYLQKAMDSAREGGKSIKDALGGIEEISQDAESIMGIPASRITDFATRLYQGTGSQPATRAPRPESEFQRLDREARERSRASGAFGSRPAPTAVAAAPMAAASPTTPTPAAPTTLGARGPSRTGGTPIGGRSPLSRSTSTTQQGSDILKSAFAQEMQRRKLEEERRKAEEEAYIGSSTGPTFQIPQMIARP